MDNVTTSRLDVRGFLRWSGEQNERHQSYDLLWPEIVRLLGRNAKKVKQVLPQLSTGVSPRKLPKASLGVQGVA